MDEDSMAGRSFWGWFKDRLEKFRKMKLKVDEDSNIQTLFYDKHIELTKDIFGVVLAFYYICDVKQVPPVSMESIADDSNPNSLCNADAIGKIAFSKFTDPPNQHHMTDVVRQKNEQFKNILSLMRKGILTNEKCEFLINRFLSKINKKE